MIGLTHIKTKIEKGKERLHEIVNPDPLWSKYYKLLTPDQREQLQDIVSSRNLEALLALVNVIIDKELEVKTKVRISSMEDVTMVGMNNLFKEKKVAGLRFLERILTDSRDALAK